MRWSTVIRRYQICWRPNGAMLLIKTLVTSRTPETGAEQPATKPPFVEVGGSSPEGVFVTHQRSSVGSDDKQPHEERCTGRSLVHWRRSIVASDLLQA